jgi:pimeloyl-ACP methyl ester carboxylesterase
MSAILLDNKIVHYEVLGRGRPLLFIHGWIGSWRYWVPVMQVVSASFRAYAVDLWGFGDTTKAAQSYSVENQVNLIESFLDEMGIGKVAIIGHGIGAVVAILTTLRSTERVDRLMLVSHPFGPDQINNRLISDSQMDLAAWLLEKQDKTEPVLYDLQKTDPEAVQRSFDDLSALDLAAQWREINKPCLFVHGEIDPLIALPDGIALPEWAHTIEFKEIGHFPMIEESRKFNRLIMDFLSLDSNTSPQNLQLKEEWKRRVR